MTRTLSSGSVTRVDRIWMLTPFKKALDARQRETVLLAQLAECVERLDDQLYRAEGARAREFVNLRGQPEQ